MTVTSDGSGSSLTWPLTLQHSRRDPGSILTWPLTLQHSRRDPGSSLTSPLTRQYSRRRWAEPAPVPVGPDSSLWPRLAHPLGPSQVLSLHVDRQGIRVREYKWSVTALIPPSSSFSASVPFPRSQLMGGRWVSEADLALGTESWNVRRLKWYQCFQWYGTAMHDYLFES